MQRLGKGIPRGCHLIAIIGIMYIGALSYYAEYLPFFGTIVKALPFYPIRYSTHRILSLLPVAYSAFIFGKRGGLLTSFVITLFLLPRAVLSPDGIESIVEAVAFLVMGLFVTWLIETQNKEKKQREQAIIEQEKLQENLLFYIKGITQAQEEERKHLARELHDDTVQSLTGLSRQIDTLMAQEEMAPALASKLEEVHQSTDTILQGVRHYCQSLRPFILDNFGLVPALESLVEDLKQRNVVEAIFELRGTPTSLPAETELTLFRIVQEALNNVSKHSGASKVEVIVEFDSTGVNVLIRDNGKGFAVPPHLMALASEGRFGLLGMQERANLLGGTISIQSELGKGTTITLRVPNAA